MELSYWTSRWRNQKTGWHLDTVNPQLKNYWDRLDLEPGARVLVPLCGKSLDMTWLAEQGYCVLGVEISEIAVQSFVDLWPESFKRNEEHSYTRWISERIEIWQGDFFAIPSKHYPFIDAIYDKAALTALPSRRRERYAEKILEITGEHTQIFLQCFEYPRREMPGPPFSVPEKELEEYFSTYFNILLLHEEDILPDLNKFKKRGLSTYLKEKIYHLNPRRSSFSP